MFTRNTQHYTAHGQNGSIYFPYFDWLRAVLALTVMLGHDGMLPWGNAPNFAVQVFFALSGWLIGNILLRLDPADLPRFYFNRAIRIWIPYLIALLLLIAASILRDPITVKWMEIVAYKATFVYNLFGTSQLLESASEMPLDGTGSHFWSVNAEEQFYLMAPLLLVISAKWGRRRLTWVLLGVLSVLLDIYPGIVLGVAAAVFFTKDETVFRTPLVQIGIVLSAATASIAIAMGYGYERMAPIVAVCLVVLLASPGRKQKLGALLGGMSYPLYLNHWIGVFMANALTKPIGLRDSIASHTLSAFLNVGLAWALFVYVERPLLARREEWYTREWGNRAVLAAYIVLGIGLTIGVCFMNDTF